MYHTIEFKSHCGLDLETAPKQFPERLLVKAGMRLQAQIKPYVVETDEGPIEVADLFFEDGTTTRMVPFICFSFVD
jgi:hypothetical protein